MRKELKMIGSKERHVFTATFIRFDLTKGFKNADLLPGDVVEFCARVSIYEKGYKGYRNDVFGRPIEKDYQLSRPTKIKKIGKK